MKSIIKKIGKKIIYGLLRLPTDLPKIVFAEFLSHYAETDKPFYFVQVGANDGISHDILFDFVAYRPFAIGIVIEPIKDYFDDLTHNYRSFPSIIPVNLALHPHLQEVTLHRLDKTKESLVPTWAKGIASLNPQHHLKSRIPTEYIVKETVKADTFMNVYKRYCAAFETLDLIQIDTEGFDSQILRMIDFKQVKPAIVKFESIHLHKWDWLLTYLRLNRMGYTIFTQGGDVIAIKYKNTV